MIITRQSVAEQIAAYLRHEISLADLVDWAETTLMSSEFDEAVCGFINEVIARLGVSDLRAFGLTWDDCEHLLRCIGFVPRVEVVAA